MTTEVYTLSHTPSTIVSKLLIDASILGCIEDDWPVFSGVLPDLPNNAVGMFDTTPIVEPRVHTGSFERKYGLQVRLRSEDSLTGRQKMNEIFEELQDASLRQVVLESDTYRVKNVAFATGIVHLGCEQDSTRRHSYVLNLLVSIMGLVV